jgi:hypothetical protein
LPFIEFYDFQQSIAPTFCLYEQINCLTARRINTDYLKKSDKRQLLTGKKRQNCELCNGSKVTATFITIKQATKQLQNE